MDDSTCIAKSIDIAIHNAINRMPTFYTSFNKKMLEAMEYSTKGGKRIRATLLCLAAKGYGTTPGAIDAGAALEMMHAYTLIHDDLPIFDNDATRRGQPSCHIKFGIQIALLAGNALFASAISLICSSEFIDNSQKPKICQSLSDAFLGVMSGQAEEHLLSLNPRQIKAEQIDQVITQKTALPFIAAIECGCILGRIGPHDTKNLMDYAKYLGKIYQVLDDISDANDNKSDINTVKIFGIEWAKSYLLDLRSKANQSLVNISCDKTVFSDFLDLTINNMS